MLRTLAVSTPQPQLSMLKCQVTQIRADVISVRGWLPR